ncbi:glycosyltransferase [Leuconostoc koreense]|nr:glycosyltransferase [Leuconostoc mesenteroides]QGM24829.1 glycosyltransferase [Leuconostoc mesenteroides subsp. mesenteroides]
MKIEIIDSLTQTNLKGVAWQIEQVKSGNSDELWLATPHEDAVHLIQKLGLNPRSVFDIYAQAYLSEIDETKGIWWGELPVPNEAQLVINKDWTKSIVSRGQQLATVRWFGDSKRIVQAVVWQDSDGQIDYKDIYLRDGRLFAKQYFSEGKLLQSDFYFGHPEVMVSDFYFEGKRNFVYVAGQKYASAEKYIVNTLSKYTENDYNVTQLQREMGYVPKRTTLTIIDELSDDKRDIRNQLTDVLKNNQHEITRVLVDKNDYLKLRMMGLPVKKVRRRN